MAPPTKSVWETLSTIDVSKHVEEKNGLKYLSWAWAWGKLKENYPEAKFTKHMNQTTSLPFFKDPDTSHAYVQCTVEAGGEVVTEVFPVLDHKNNAVVNPSAFQVNTAMQRCMTKAIAYLGLGFYIYAGEDLPVLPKHADFEMPDGTKSQISGAEMIAETFMQFIPLQKSQVELRSLWENNTQALMVLKEHDETRYNAVLGTFKKHKEKLNV